MYQTFWGGNPVYHVVRTETGRLFKNNYGEMVACDIFLLMSVMTAETSAHGENPMKFGFLKAQAKLESFMSICYVLGLHNIRWQISFGTS